jgi:hypothetical protein
MFSPRSVACPSFVAKALRAGALAGGMLIAGFGLNAPAALAAPATLVDLGQASSYAVLSGASVGNTVSTGSAPHTTLRGDLGVKVGTQPTGFPPGIVTGASHIGDGDAIQAHADAVAAYTEIAARTGGAPLAGALAGATVGPGLHTIAGAVSNTTTVTLDAGGDADAVFVFQINGAMAMAAGSQVKLSGGAQASRVFWQVNGAGAVGAGASFAGTLIALNAVAIGNGTVINGRAFAINGALTLDANEFYSAPPVVTIDGGETAITTDTTPTISGKSDLESVTVRVGTQSFTVSPSGGTWSVQSALLANATYPVAVSGTDGAGNEGSATQRLTVDTVLPVVGIDGGVSVTNDSTPTISGTTDVAQGSIVRVSVDEQDLTALVHSGGTWNVSPAPLNDGTRTVTASVTDEAGNDGTAGEQLTIDTASPALTIADGASALSNDATPTISGTADVASGTPVTVTLADETLTGSVQDGSWSVTAADLSDGPHRVVIAISDAAGNPSGATQTLTIDTACPAAAITGGAAVTTTDISPTLTGTFDAAPGTTITVSIAGQTMTTLLQTNGTWNATPSPIGEGTWPVVATAPDPAGNVGTATQLLTIFTFTPAPAPTATPTPVTPVAPTVSLPPVAVAPPSVAAPVNAAAKATVARDASQKVSGSSLSIATNVAAPSEGRVVATATGTIRVDGVKKAITLTSTTATIAAGKNAALKLKPSGTKKAVQAALKALKNKKATATITVKLVDAAGNTRVATRTVKLTK